MALKPILQSWSGGNASAGAFSQVASESPSAKASTAAASSMHTSSRPKSRAVRMTALLTGLTLLACTTAFAQTLARPGWAGSGLTPEPWWRHAVVYRLDAGQLPTLTQLPSVQAFGIDAVLLTPQSMQPAPEPTDTSSSRSESTSTPTNLSSQPESASSATNLSSRPKSASSADAAERPAAGATTGTATDAPAPEAPLTVDDFLFESSRLRIRVLIPLDVTALDHDALMALTTSWLRRGAAGFLLVNVDKLPRTATADDSPSNVTPGPVHLHRHNVTATSIHLAAAEPTLVTDLHKLLATFPGDRILVGETTTDPIANAMPSLQLRIVSLGKDPASDPSTATRLAAYSSLAAPHLLLSLTPKDGVLTPVDAAMLLANDQPAILDSSVITPAILAKVFPPLASMATPDAPKKPETPPTPPRSDVYGAYKAYVPKADPAIAERKRKAEAEAAATEKANIVLDTFPVQPLYEAISPTPEGAIAFFHRLIQLHRSNATLHDATLYDLDATAPAALAWAGLHTGVPPIIVVCNPTSADLRINLADSLRKLNLGRNMSRTLLHTGPASGIEPVESITVPPNGVYVGELQRGASYGR